jgi:hypothetical protein
MQARTAGPAGPVAEQPPPSRLAFGPSALRSALGVPSRRRATSAEQQAVPRPLFERRDWSPLVATFEKAPVRLPWRVGTRAPSLVPSRDGVGGIPIQIERRGLLDPGSRRSFFDAAASHAQTYITTKETCYGRDGADQMSMISTDLVVRQGRTISIRTLPAEGFNHRRPGNFRPAFSSAQVVDGDVGSPRGCDEGFAVLAIGRDDRDLSTRGVHPSFSDAVRAIGGSAGGWLMGLDRGTGPLDRGCGPMLRGLAIDQFRVVGVVAQVLRIGRESVSFAQVVGQRSSGVVGEGREAADVVDKGKLHGIEGLDFRPFTRRQIR